MNYAILRTEKIKKGDVAAMAHHHDRSRPTLNADPAQQQENKLMAGVASAAVPELVNARIKSIEERQGKKTRKDAVAAIEVLMTASPEFFEGREEWQIRVWAERSTEWAQKHFGKDNVLSAVLHRDETTPHLHIVAFPETPDHKLSAKHWLDGVEKMQAMQDDYAEAVKIDGLERGVKGSKAKHTDIKRWYAEGLPRAREQVKAMTERALELGINIEKTLERQFMDFAERFKKPEPVLAQAAEKEKSLGKELVLEKKNDRKKDWGMGL